MTTIYFTFTSAEIKCHFYSLSILDFFSYFSFILDKLMARGSNELPLNILWEANSVLFKNVAVHYHTVWSNHLDNLAKLRKL